MHIERHRLLEIAAQERKAYADSLVDQFESTGSNLPADANPRQLLCTNQQSLPRPCRMTLPAGNFLPRN